MQFPFVHDVIDIPCEGCGKTGLRAVEFVVKSHPGGTVTLCYECIGDIEIAIIDNAIQSEAKKNLERQAD